MICVLDVVIGRVSDRVICAGDAVNVHCIEDEVRLVVVEWSCIVI